MKYIGYIGKPYDMLLYMAKTLSKLNINILIIDLSEDEELKAYIKHGMDLDSKKCIVNYRDINYTRKLPTEEELKEFNDAIVFLAYGEKYKNLNKQINIDRYYLSFNIMPSNIYNAKNIIKEIDQEKLRIIIRDIISDPDIERTKSLLESALDEEKYIYLYFDMQDFENSVTCQAEQNINFRNISKVMKQCLINEIQYICPETKKSTIEKALKIASKGE